MDYYTVICRIGQLLLFVVCKFLLHNYADFMEFTYVCMKTMAIPCICCCVYCTETGDDL